MVESQLAWVSGFLGRAESLLTYRDMQPEEEMHLCGVKPLRHYCWFYLVPNINYSYVLPKNILSSLRIQKHSPVPPSENFQSSFLTPNL